MKQQQTIPVELLKKYDRPGPRYTSYPTAPVWSDEVDSAAYAETLKDSSSRVDAPLAIYNHIPFCERRCLYCGCNTVITRNQDRVANYVKHMTQEIDRVSALLGDRREIAQCHFGGGTPTYLDNDLFGEVMISLKSGFDFQPGAELSIEVDPRVTTFEQLEYLRQCGFNRISVGVQDFNKEVQVACGRVQSYEQVFSLMEHCRKLGFKGINIDLIYGLPKQTPESFAVSLNQALKLGPDRVAVYSFAYLPQMKAHQRKILREDLPTTDVKYELFAIAVDRFIGAGYHQIGMDHFALPGDELSMAQDDGRLHRNFMGYTVQSAPEMIGLGVSSIGYIGNAFFQNYPGLDRYGQAIESDEFAVYRGMKLSQDDLVRQFVINSLMCNFYLDFDRFATKFGRPYHDYFKKEHGNLGEFFDDSFLEETDRGLAIKPLGRTFVRNIAMTYDAYFKKSDPKGPTFSRTI